MTGVRILLGCAAAISGFALTTSPAAAAATFHVAPRTVIAGDNVRVFGSCEANTVGWAISKAFRHTRRLDFAGIGAVPFATSASGQFAVTAHVPARRAADRYTVTVRCGGGVLSVSRTLRVVTHQRAA